MKRALFLLVFFYISLHTIVAQNVGINTTGAVADPSAILDLNSGNSFGAPNGKGLLIPNAALSSNTDNGTIKAPATSLLVYVPSGSGLTPAGYYYNSSSSGTPIWMPMGTSSSSSGWSLTGNASTSPGTNFLGTTDAEALEFEVNNQKAGWLDYLTTTANSFFGCKAGNSNTGKYNTAMGFQALQANMSTGSNTAIGYQAGFSNTGSLNVFVGDSAGYGSTSATGVTFIGDRAGAANAGANYNTAIGLAAFFHNTALSGNIAIGDSALFTQSDPTAFNSGNVAIGNSALYANQPAATTNSGNDNTAIGQWTLRHNTTGYQNTANGYDALYANTTGQGNVAVGYNTLTLNTTGSGNIAIGANALAATTYTNISLQASVAVGYDALTAQTTGNRNLGVGTLALSHLQTGTFNTAVGDGTLIDVVSTSNNTAVGFGAAEICTGGDNTVVGFEALVGATQAASNANTIIGSGALTTGMTPINNTVMGYKALYIDAAGPSFGCGDSNTAIGWKASYNNGMGTQNTAIGYEALYNTTQSSSTIGYNTGVGYNALFTNTTGTNNTALGYQADMGSGTLTNATAIGNGALATVSNSVVLGNTVVTSIGGYATSGWTSLSDSRFKKNIQTEQHGLDFVMKLKPVTYNLDIHKLNAFIGVKNSDEQAIATKEAIICSGFLAQDVEQAANEVNYNFSGVIKPQNEKDHYKLAYSDFVVPLVKAVQELKAENDSLKQEMADMRKLVTALAEKVNAQPIKAVR